MVRYPFLARYIEFHLLGKDVAIGISEQDGSEEAVVLVCA
jgi:hypothetical protein